MTELYKIVLVYEGYEQGEYVGTFEECEKHFADMEKEERKHAIILPLE